MVVSATGESCIYEPQRHNTRHGIYICVRCHGRARSCTVYGIYRIAARRSNIIYINTVYARLTLIHTPTATGVGHTQLTGHSLVSPIYEAAFQKRD